MRIVVCHNFYQQAGGEDQVFADEVALLTSRGHDVVTFTKRNDDLSDMPSWKLAAGTVWNRRSARELDRLVRDHRAEIVHFHNTLPLISPAAYYAARRAGAAVVQSLHNYRLACPKATFFRDGRVCEDCLATNTAWPAIRHGCYRDNRAASGAIAAMLTFHRARRTYRRAVDAYIALSQFARDKMIAAGLPADKMHFRPNFMSQDPGAGSGRGHFALYLGRLSPEKGIETLLTAWQQHDPGLPLVICGTGPLASQVEQAVSQCDRIAWFPDLSRDEVLQRLGNASLLVVPSVWYEGFPKTIVEAYSKGTPVVASLIGSLAELVHDGVTGSMFNPGDAAHLAATVHRLSDEPDQLARMRLAARRKFETEYMPTSSYARLREIYDLALSARHGTVARAAKAIAERAVAPKSNFDAMDTVRIASHLEDTVTTKIPSRDKSLEPDDCMTGAAR